MKKAIILSMCLLLSICFLVVSSTATNAADPKRVLLGSTKTTSSYFVAGVEWAKLLNKYLGDELQVTLVESAGMVDNLRRMEKGEFALQLFGNPSPLYMAYHGQGPYKGHPMRSCRNLAWYGGSSYVLVVRADRGINSIQDLDGKKIANGPPGSSSNGEIKMVFDALGIKPKWHESGYAEGVNAMKDRRIDGYMKSCPLQGLDSTLLDIMSSTKVKILGFSKANVDKVSPKFPALVWNKVPAGYWKEFPDMPEYWSWGPDFVFGAHFENISEDLGYKITKITVEHGKEMNWAGIKTADPGKKLLQVLRSMPDPVWLHKGAVKYFRERGLEIPEKAIPPEAR